MTKKTDALDQEIQKAKARQEVVPTEKQQNGYQIAFELLTNLFGCVLIGASLGIFFQNVFHTPALLTAGLTVFGGFAGLWSVVRYAMERDSKGL